MKVNLDEVESKSFTLYDNGPYRVRVNSIEDVQASTGNNQLRVKTVFVGGEYDGKQLTDHITMIESVAWKIKKFLISVGLPAKGPIDTDSGEFRNVLNQCINRTAIWVVGQKAGQDGTMRNVVLDYQEDPNAVEPAEDDVPEFLQKTKDPTPAGAQKWPEEEE